MSTILRSCAHCLRAIALPGVALIAACSSIDNSWQSISGAHVERTFNAPIAHVKPAFVSTLSQMGMPISALDVRGKNEVIKARKADRSVEIEFERLGASSTRVRVTGSDNATTNQVIRDTEKRLTAG
ncbi:MAG TPA: hypothetical protein VMM15_09480 [Bradyrhizobium sp.]|nr:hypothetical protein [Bradyrhizobium sp.]